MQTRRLTSLRFEEFSRPGHTKKFPPQCVIPRGHLDRMICGRVTITYGLICWSVVAGESRKEEQARRKVVDLAEVARQRRQWRSYTIRPYGSCRLWRRWRDGHQSCCWCRPGRVCWFRPARRSPNRWASCPSDSWCNGGKSCRTARKPKRKKIMFNISSSFICHSMAVIVINLFRRALSPNILQ